jgi:hypothetical protein
MPAVYSTFSTALREKRHKLSGSLPSFMRQPVDSTKLALSQPTGPKLCHQSLDFRTATSPPSLKFFAFSLPLKGTLREYIETELPVTNDAKAPLFPKAFQTASVQCDRVGTLSDQFYEVIVKAGLVPVRSYAKKLAKNRASAADLG